MSIPAVSPSPSPSYVSSPAPTTAQHFTFKYPTSSSLSSAVSKDAPESAGSRRFLPFEPSTPSDRVDSTRPHISTISFSPPASSSKPTLEIPDSSGDEEGSPLESVRKGTFLPFASPTHLPPASLSVSTPVASHKKTRGPTFGSAQEILSFFEKSPLFAKLPSSDLVHPRVAVFFENSEISQSGVITPTGTVSFFIAVKLAIDALNSNKEKKRIPNVYLNIYALAFIQLAAKILKGAEDGSSDSKESN